MAKFNKKKTNNQTKSTKTTMVSLNLMPQIAESQFANESRHLLGLQAVPTPDDDCCWFFSDTGFGGEKLQLCHNNATYGLY